MTRTCPRPSATEPDPVGALFASRSVPVHLARGAAGGLLLVASLVLTLVVSPRWLLLGLGSVVLWRGCVSCWALGLAATRARADADGMGRAPAGYPGEDASARA